MKKKYQIVCPACIYIDPYIKFDKVIEILDGKTADIFVEIF